jgi:hypothetical protein
MPFLSASVAGQNLVPNPGFEDLLQCPTGPSQLAGTAFWFDPNNNVQGTPDYFHGCATGTHSTPVSFLGFQEPADGEGYAGIFLYEGSQVLADWREYLQAELLEELTADRCYQFSVLANLADNSSRTTNALGVRFYNEAVQLPDPFIPGDEPHLELPPGTFLNTTDWTALQGTYFASGGERFLMIGNYRDNANTTVQQLSTNGNFAYAFIDAVSLVPCVPTTLPGTTRPELLIRKGALSLVGVPADAPFRVIDALGRTVAEGRMMDGDIALPSNAQGLLILSVAANDRAWHYKFIVP